MTPGLPQTLDSLIVRERPSSSEAVAIVLELCRRIRPAALAGAVTPAVSRATVLLDASGEVAMRGGTPVEDDQTTSLLGHLLLELLDEGPDTDRLRRVAARAARSLPGGARRLSVRRLASALRRNAPADPRASVAAFVQRASGMVRPEVASAVADTHRVAVVARGAARLFLPLWRRLA